MKNKEEIEKLGSKYATTHEDVSDKLSKYLVSACFQDGYTQCQEDMAEKKYTEEDVINIVNKSRETGLTAEYLMYLKRIY